MSVVEEFDLVMIPEVRPSALVLSEVKQRVSPVL